MKKYKHQLIAILITFFPSLTYAQFDYYGPQQFGDILNNSYTQAWTASNISTIENKKYLVILDQATQSNVIMLNTSDKSVLVMKSIDSVSGVNATYGSMMRSVFQILDENTHYENDAAAASGTYTPLSGNYKLNPLLHSYFNVNANGLSEAISTDGGSVYMAQETETGYLLLSFEGTPASTTIKAISQWVYNATSGNIEENTSWVDSYLMINGTALTWTSVIGNASNFTLTDATDLLAIEVALGSDFNPLSTTYQPNATAEISNTIEVMANSILKTTMLNDLDAQYTDQLNHSASATTAASTALDAIETTLLNNGDSLIYPKAFYLALRENMLSHIISSSSIYNAQEGERTVEHVYFTNAADDSGVPHPFMVMATHAVSARPNMLVDVNRPPGGTGGPGYAESQITKHGKLGEFLIKIPLKDYGLITTLLDNDLSTLIDLAADFDAIHGSTTTKDVYNYTSTKSCGIAVDGVSIYPGYNNNLRFAAEDAEITNSGIHVGGGLELHYHTDGHAFNGNGINLYNLADYAGNDHPPVIGMALDGRALFGKYETAYNTMDGYSIALDTYGGHDHGDDFGYHYHAHTKTVTAQTNPYPTFDQHFLLVGAWKGRINDIPGFDEQKTNQLKDADLGRYAGASVDGNNDPSNNDPDPNDPQNNDPVVNDPDPNDPQNNDPVITDPADNDPVIDSNAPPVNDAEGPDKDEPAPLGVNTLLSDNNVVIYPNPAKDEITIVVNTAFEISITNLNGQVDKLFKINAGTTTVSLQDLSDGVYFIEGINTSNTFLKKVIIKK